MVSMELMLIWGLMFLNTLMIASGFYIYNGLKKLGLRFDALLVNPFFQKPIASNAVNPPNENFYKPVPAPPPLAPAPALVPEPVVYLDEKDQEINALRYELEELKRKKRK